MLRREEPRFEIHVGPDDLDAVIAFFGGTAYRPERIDERTLALTPPAAVDNPVARREVGVYLRLLERLCPGLRAHVAD